MNIAALNKKRNCVRYSSIAVAVVELAAILMIMGGIKLPGVIIGLAALVGGAVYKRKGKKAYQEECCRLQTLTALGVQETAYIGEKKETTEWMREMKLTPASTQLVEPLLLHVVNGKLRGVETEIAEVTFGCQEAGKKTATYSSGVLVRVKLTKSAEPALLLGRYAFKHAALRAEYEKDGMRLSPAGGKERGWYALTPGAVSPDEMLLEKWDKVCDAAKQRAALSVDGDRLAAFFNGQFYTGEFALEEELTEGALRKHSFAAIVPLMELVEAMNG